MAVNTTNHRSSLFAWLSLTALGASCGGGGGGSSAVAEVSVLSAQFASSISQAPETSGSVLVEVELTVPLGTLLEPLEFFVTDLGTGSAVEGSDYIALGALTLTFPAGAQHGDRMSVTWTPLDDGSSEGNETLNLALFPVGDAVVHGRTELSAVILDNESSTLLVEEGSKGGNFVPPNANLPMGHQTIGIPTQTGIDVFLDNIGVSPLRISAPTLVSGDTDDFVIETPIQIGSTAVVESSPVDVLSPLFGMSAATGRQASSIPLQLSNELLDQLESHERVFLRGTPIPGQEPIDFELKRIPSPVRVDATLVIDGETIPGGVRSVASNGSSWSGHIVGDPDSQVHISLSEAGSRGWIMPSAEGADLLHLRAGNSFAAPSTLVRNSVLRGADAGTAAELCSGTSEVPGQERGRLVPAATVDGGSHVPYVCRLALETDYQLYAKFGDVSALTTYVTQLVAAVSDRFHADIATTFEIVYLGIHTTPADGWTSQDGGGSVSDLLYEFQEAWAPVYGGTWPANADLAHFLSGSLGGGMSFINVLCNQNYGFGVSTGLTASTDWSTFTGGNSALYWDFDVLAHELGHAFNAKHTHEYCPPLDTCSLGCQGQSCERGTIMSYCHACPGGVANIDLEFNPRIANEMRIAVNNSCLSEATLASGDATFFRLFFRPLARTGAKSATLEFTHDATSAPSPYRITLSGFAE